MYNKTELECPECGEEEVDEWEEKIYKEKIAKKHHFCNGCRDYKEVVGLRELGDEDKANCKICSKEFMPSSMTFRCDNCKQEKFVRATWDAGHEFGLVIPQESGIVWKHQTGGIMCKKVCIEGVFIPLNYPEVWDDPSKDLEDRNKRDLLSELQSANYVGQSMGNVPDIWKLIDEELWFDYEEVEPPTDDMYSQQEGLKWIKITGVEDKEHYYNDRDNLVGKTVALFYPNSD